jgi:hypothetical protein
LTLLVLTLVAQPSAAEHIIFSEPDQKTQKIIETLVDDLHAEQRSDWRMHIKKEHYSSFWVSLQEGQEPYLFIIPIHLCGAANCYIKGYKKDNEHWLNIYNAFGGESIEVLDSNTQGVRDIRQSETQGAGRSIKKTFLWDGNRYVESKLEAIP